MLRGFWIVCVATALAGRAWAQTPLADSLAALPLLTPAQVRVDADHDGLPDLEGQRVRVAGRASVAALPSEGRFNAALQTGGRGLSLSGGAVTVPVAPGDSLVAAGRLVFRSGQLHLATDGYTVVPGLRKTPVSRLLHLNEALEPFEGMLVAFEATVVGRRQVPVGTTLMLAAQDSLFYALAFGDRGEALFGHVHSGKRVRVVGVLGQHDVQAPFNQGYQVYPASAADVRMIGLGTAFFRLIALVGALLLVAALGAVVFLLGRSRRRLARQLQSENRYRLLFEHTDDAAFLHEVTGGEEGALLKLIAANAAASRLLGVPQQVLERRPPRTFLADPSQAERLMQGLEREGRIMERVAMRTPDGRDLTVEMDAFAFVENGRRIVLTLLTDVTQRAAYEQGLIEARERAEEYARLQQSFVANMSHEIRTPLTGIIGFADVLREELEGEQQGFAEMIEAGARHLLATLDSVLEMARIEAQGERLSLHPIDLARTLRETTGVLSSVARQRAIRFDVDAPEALVAYGNASAFGRIVSNLVGNALKFTPEGGRVDVHLMATEDHDPEAVLTVRDTGIGISEEFQAQLFRPFAQEATGDHRPHGGTGLGLALTLRLTQMLGGSIHVQSRKGAGATFTVRFPLRVPAYLDGLPETTGVTTMTS